MNLRHLVSNIVCGFIPNKRLRDLTRVKIRYNTKPFVRFVRDYIGDADAKITTCVGYGCSNFIVLVDSRFAFKFPLKDDGTIRALRELRITTALRKYTKFKIPEMEIIKWNNMAVRKYEFFPGVIISEVPPRVANANRQKIAEQIAQFIYEIGCADPVEIRDLKPTKTTRPGYLYGWFHNDILNVQYQKEVQQIHIILLVLLIGKLLIFVRLNQGCMQLIIIGINLDIVGSLLTLWTYIPDYILIKINN